MYNRLHGHSFRKYIYWDFPGGPVAKIPCFQCRGPGSDPRSGNPVAQMVENLPGSAGKHITHNRVVVLVKNKIINQEQNEP